MTLDNFHLFPSLPLEIQDKIWELCLPRRVISPCYGTELQYFVRSPSRIPYLPVRALIPFRPPLISQVCTRAHATAVRCGQYTPVLVFEGHSWFPTDESAWLNKNTDWIYLTSSAVKRCLGRRKGMVGGDTSSQVFELARDVRRPLLISSMISNDDMELLNEDMDETIASKLYNQFLRERELFYYVMVEVNLVVSRQNRETVVKTGLFGLLGEDIAIVPCSDKETLQKYASLYDMYDLKASWFHEAIKADLNTELKGKNQMVYEPRTLIRRLLEDICEERGTSDEEPEEIVSVEGMMNEDDSLNSDHPVVKQLGITMPTCEKVVIFELRFVDTMLEDSRRYFGREEK